MRKAHCWTGRDCPTNLNSKHGFGECYGCDHPDCIYGHYGEPGFDATCMLMAGHEGAHEWVSDDDIGLDFIPLSLPEEER